MPPVILICNHPEAPELILIETVGELIYCDLCSESQIHAIIEGHVEYREMYIDPDDLKICEKCIENGKYFELE